MAHIKEPKGVDFIIQSEPLTDEERAAISEYIRNYKAKQKNNPNNRGRQTASKRKNKSTPVQG